MLGSSSSTVSRGATLSPTPAPTSPWTVPLLSERNTILGVRPVEARWDSTWSIALQWLKPMSGWSAISLSVGVRLSADMGDPAGTTRTYGSVSSSTVS